MKLRLLLTCLLTWGALLGPARSAPADDHPQKVLQNFREYLAQQELAAELREKVAATLDKSQDDPQYGITEALILLHPEYGQAIDSADRDDLDSALKALPALTQSENPYLAADARFYLARTLMNHEHFEEALPLLAQLTGDQGVYTAHQGSAQYYRAVAQAGLLDNEAAVESFMQFLQFNPDAPERLRVSAWRQVQHLQSIKSGQLDDIYQRMDYSRRRLELIETDDDTQSQQGKIVDMLTKLIKEAEKQECSASSQNSQSQSQPQGSPEQQQAQSQPGQSQSQSGSSSSNPNGTAIVKSYDDSPASPWSRLRDRSRDPANNAIKEKLPARYRDIVEKYIEAANGDRD